jgi:hypothetical protein
MKGERNVKPMKGREKSEVYKREECEVYERRED